MNGTDARGYIYICRTGPGPRGLPIENTFINIFFQCHGTSINCTRHLHVCTPSKIDLMALYAHVVSINYRKSGNFGVKIFHAIIFRVKIISYVSRPYENILTTKIFQ